MGADKHDASYYFKCMIGGSLACGLTHAVMTPLDLVKCRRQVDPKLYSSLFSGIRTISSTQGVGGLMTGWFPTLVGYSMQGLGKFGFYELFKDVFAGIVGPENAIAYRTIGWSLSSASAEVIADTLLCPSESIKVRMQTTIPSPSFGQAVSDIKAQNGFFKIIVPLWARQIPYTVVKFVFFEKAVEFFYKNVWTQPKSSYSKATQLGITFLSGYTAGVLCAIVSHPADTMVSKLNGHPDASTKGTGYAIKSIYSEIGFGGLWRGLGTRILMIGTLTGLQWWIYDTFKTAVGLQTSGGAAAANPVQPEAKKH